MPLSEPCALHFHSLSCYLRQLPFCLSNGISVAPSCVCGSAEVWRRTAPHRLVSLNTWAPAGDAVSGGYATFRSWSLAKGSTSMWADFDVLWPYLASCFFLSLFFCLLCWMTVWSISFLSSSTFFSWLLPCLPGHEGPLSLNLRARINPFSP